jgi:hypothetical protein
VDQGQRVAHRILDSRIQVGLADANRLGDDLVVPGSGPEPERRPMLLVFNYQKMVCDFRTVLGSVPDPYLTRTLQRPREKTSSLPAVEKERFTSVGCRNQATQSEVPERYGIVSERFRVPP